MARSHVEGSGLGAPERTDFEPTTDASLRARGIWPMSLDQVYERLPAGTVYTWEEFLSWIRRQGKLDPAAQRADILALAHGCVNGGAVVAEWFRGMPKLITKNTDLKNQRQKLSKRADRTVFEMCCTEWDQWVAVPVAEAPAFRKRVALALIEREQAEAERAAARRQRLRDELASGG